ATGKLGETAADLFGDVLAAADHRISFTKPPLDHCPVELRQPLTMHVQDDFDFGVESPDYRNELRVIVDMNNVVLVPSQVARHLQSISQVVQPGGKEGSFNLTGS
ncbi:unnamed protein product, partial [marine sediment metagenome]